jgi:peroxiredoxin
VASGMSKKARLVTVIAIIAVAAIVGTALSGSSCSPSGSTLVSQKAPDFTLPTLAGANVTLSELEGASVVLVFWTTNCQYCNLELHLLEDAMKQSEGEMMVIATNIGQPISEVQRFFGDYEPTMTVALDQDREVFQKYSQEDNPQGYVPLTCFVDSEGTVKQIKIGAFQNETELWDTLSSIFGITTP